MKMKERNAIIALFSLLGFNVSILSYPWPLSPQNEQHRVSGTFCECRGERDHFHDGIDIPLFQGGYVLSVADGTVLWLQRPGANSGIRVGGYCYVHVNPNPNLNEGDWVEVGDTVGTTNSLNHIHFKDGGGASHTIEINALREDGISPFVDTYKPTIDSVKFYVNGTNIQLGNTISGVVDIVARAKDGIQVYGGYNNGLYKMSYQAFAYDSVTPVTDYFSSYQFDALPNNNYITNVYAPGSNTSTYYYYVTNHIESDSYWDTRYIDTGDYVVAVYASDIQGNTDTAYVLVTVVESDTLPPASPILKSVSGDFANNLTIEWYPNTEEDLKGYRIYHSFDGVSWNCTHNESRLTRDKTNLTVASFPNDLALFFRLTAVDSSAIPNESDPSDIYGTRLTSTGPKILIVDGFDRTTGGWRNLSHPFAMSYGLAVDTCGFAFDTYANEEVIDDSLQLSNYDALIYLFGDNDATFNHTEQALLTQYLEEGGNVFVSGSKIGYDLGLSGDSLDKIFYNEYLKATYVGETTETDSVDGIPVTIFDRASYPLDDGTHSSYDVLEADYIDTACGSVLNLHYYGTFLGAGVQYEGTFGDGTDSGKLVYLAFPFETVYPESSRIDIMERVLEFFEIDIGISDLSYSDKPRLFQNYPNPFSQTTVIRYSLGVNSKNHSRLTPYTLRIYDLSGRLVRQFAIHDSQFTSIVWNGTDKYGVKLPAGVYFCKLVTANSSEVRKMTLLR